jgi:3-methyladenine DNA glycosylase Tag
MEKGYTKKQYYTIDNSVFRNKSKITAFNNKEEAEKHCEQLNKQFGDIEAYALLYQIENEITLYEDAEYSAETILNSIKAML